MQNKGHYRYKSKIFYTMILVSVLPVIILGLYSYHIYVKEAAQRKNLTMQTTVNQVKNRVENVLGSIKQYYAEVENKEAIKELIYAKDLYYNQYSRLKEGIEVLSGPVYLREYIIGYTFINTTQNWVISNYGMYHYDELANEEALEELLEKGQWGENNIQCFWINRMDKQEPSIIPNGKNIIMSKYVMAVRLPMLAAGEKCMLLINLDSNRLINLIAENLDNMDITVINTDNELVYTSNPSMGDYCTKYGKRLDSVSDYSGIKMQDGTVHCMAATSATTNGLIYIASYNVSSVQEGAGQILYMSVILLLVISLVLMFARMGTKIVYTPVSELINQFHSVLKDSKPVVKDEFTWLSEGLNQLVENKESLERMVEDQKELLVELFLSRLIHGELTQERIDEGVLRFNLQKKPCYIAAGIRIVQEKYKSDSMEQDALTSTVVEHMPKELYQELFGRPVIKRNIIFLILGADTKEEAEEKVERLYEKIILYVAAEYGCQTHCGVSQVFYKLKHIRTAINEGGEALKNSESLKFCENQAGGVRSDLVKAISFYADFGKSDQPAYQYDLCAEQEIRKAIDECEAEKAFGITDQFIDRMIEKGISRQDRYFFLHRFQVAILQVALEAGLSINQIFEKDEVNLFSKLDSIVDPENIKQFYNTQVIEPIIKSLRQYRRSHSMDIMEQVLALVKEKNGDITLSECAEKLNYHPSYIWRVLKTERNMTFTDFVAVEKLELAKEMLTQTSLSVAEIAQKLNYTNTQNFIRFFNKHEGITPGKFRQEHKKQENGK